MLAIVIPYYNLTFFDATLQSLANQTDKRFKVYIGNDASTEDPSPLLKKFEGKFDFRYHKFEINFGEKYLTRQWDRCIEMVQEEKWIMILGDDDMLENSVVKTFYKHLNVFKNQSKVVRFASKLITEKTKTTSDIFEHPIWEKAEDSYYRRFKGLTRSSLSEYVYEKEAYMKYGFYPYPLAWHSDDKAWLEFSENTPIYTINEAVVLVRNSSINISGRTDNEDLKNQASLKFYKYIISHKLPYYTIEQRIFFLRAFENAIQKLRNLKIQEWMFLIFLHSRNFEFNSFKKLIKRFVKSVLNRGLRNPRL